MQTSQQDQPATTASYLAGFGLALILTAVPFGLVATRALASTPTFIVVAVTAIAQMTVHLRFFLHLDLKRRSQERLVTLAFTGVLIVMMMGGSLWILFDLHTRMM